MDAKAEPAGKAGRESDPVEWEERAGELGKNRSALCQGSPIQEQIRVRKREASREEGGPGKSQEEGTSRPTLASSNLKRRLFATAFSFFEASPGGVEHPFQTAHVPICTLRFS